MRGVDISHWQKGLTIRQLREAGFAFAILKVTEGTGLVDDVAFPFYREAYELGFPTGCYCYSHALTPEAARDEAWKLLETINGFPMPCGVFLDMEAPEQLALPAGALFEIACAWCAEVSAAGYVPGIYGSDRCIWAKLDPGALPDGTIIWVARYGPEPDTPCDLWQASETGSVPGFAGAVDIDQVRSAYFERLVKGVAPDQALPRDDVTDTDVGDKPDISDALGLLAAYLQTEEFRKNFVKFLKGSVRNEHT